MIMIDTTSTTRARSINKLLVVDRLLLKYGISFFLNIDFLFEERIKEVEKKKTTIRRTNKTYCPMCRP